VSEGQVRCHECSQPAEHIQRHEGDQQCPPEPQALTGSLIRLGGTAFHLYHSSSVGAPSRARASAGVTEGTTAPRRPVTATRGGWPCQITK
jgi:hypothetical protein